jgi:hypothetical protein
MGAGVNCKKCDKQMTFIVRVGGSINLKINLLVFQNWILSILDF